MKYFALFLFCLLPVTASAAKLSNCDTKTFDVTIINGGEKRVAKLAPADASIQEFGPVVSFQIPGQRPVVVTEPGDEYCIWKGKITIQRRNPGNDANGGFNAR